MLRFIEAVNNVISQIKLLEVEAFEIKKNAEKRAREECWKRKRIPTLAEETQMLRSNPVAVLQRLGNGVTMDNKIEEIHAALLKGPYNLVTQPAPNL